MDNGLDGYVNTMTRVLEEIGSVVIAFSGGIDSTLLTVMAHEILGDNSLAITAWSPALAARDLDDAKWFCLLYTSPSPRDGLLSRMPSSA